MLGILGYGGERAIPKVQHKKGQAGVLEGGTPGEERPTPLPWRRDGPTQYTTQTTIECFRCGKKGHVKPDYCVKLEEAKCSMVATTAPPE